MSKVDSDDGSPDLDSYLAGDSEISRQYRQQAHEQTPAELDERVLAAAHGKARTQTPARKPARRPSRLLQVLIAVTLILLGLALTLDLLQDQSIVPTENLLPGPATGNQTPDNASSASPATAAQPDSATQQPAAPGTQANSPAAPDQGREEPEALAPGRGQTDAPNSSEPNSSEPESIESEPVQAPPPDSEDEPIQAPPIPAQVTPPAPAASSPREIEQETIEPVPAQSAPAQPARQPEQAQEPYSGPPLPQAPAASGQTSDEPAFRETAQTWIRHIVFLADTGQRDEARAELGKYRQRHPQSRVPAELEELDSP